MKILVTGATGYIGKRLIPLLVNEGHDVVCAVRDKLRVNKNYLDEDHIEIVEADFLNLEISYNMKREYGPI